MTEMATIPLPCSVAALERAILHASHQGHWHDAEVRLGDDNAIVISRPKIKSTSEMPYPNGV